MRLCPYTLRGYPGITYLGNASFVSSCIITSPCGAGVDDDDGGGLTNSNCSNSSSTGSNSGEQYILFNSDGKTAQRTVSVVYLCDVVLCLGPAAEATQLPPPRPSTPIHPAGQRSTYNLVWLCSSAAAAHKTLFDMHCLRHMFRISEQDRPLAIGEGGCGWYRVARGRAGPQLQIEKAIKMM